MNREEAKKILGLTKELNKEELKKHYRKVISLAHPDVLDADYPFSAQEINDAYQFLSDHPRRAGIKDRSVWDADINLSAYRERDIFQYAEDADGEIIGKYCLTKGKYIWDPEIEEFSLFLHSLFVLSGQIINEWEIKKRKNLREDSRMLIQAELVYMLAQQYIDFENALLDFCEEDYDEQNPVNGQDNERINQKYYYFPAMMEITSRSAREVVFSENDYIYPHGFMGHKLLLRGKEQTAIGYLSFLEDALYYIVMPILESKKAQVKMQIAPKKEVKSRYKRGVYHNLHLWIMMEENAIPFKTEVTNQKIERFLQTKI